MITEVESQWLAYARDVVSDDEHIAACARLGGSPDHPGVDAIDLRWPGVIGETFRPGQGVLAVGNVHRDFASGSMGVAGRDRLVSAVRTWRDGGIDDESFLAASREVYLRGFTSWTVGKHIVFVLAGIGASLTDLAYTNAARCQYPEVEPVLPSPAATKKALQVFCLQRFPITDLVSRIEPRVVLFTSTSGYDAQAGTLPAEVLAVGIHQLNGNLTRPLEVARGVLPAKTPRTVWVPALAEVLSRGPD